MEDGRGGGRIPGHSTCCFGFCSLMAASSSPRVLREVHTHGDSEQGTQVTQKPSFPSFPLPNLRF